VNLRVLLVKNPKRKNLHPDGFPVCSDDDRSMVICLVVGMLETLLSSRGDAKDKLEAGSLILIFEVFGRSSSTGSLP
jgi:hypothetical protein